MICIAFASRSVSVLPGNAYREGRKLIFWRLFTILSWPIITTISLIFGGVNGWIMTYFSWENCFGLARITLSKNFSQMTSTGIWQWDMDKQFKCVQLDIKLNTLEYEWLKSFMLRLSSLQDFKTFTNRGVLRKQMSSWSSRQSWRFRYSNGWTRPLSSENNRERRKLKEKSIFFSL